MRSRFAIAFLSLLLSLSLVGCGEKKADDATATAPPPESASATDATLPASPGGTAEIPSVSSGTTVVVMLEDGRIALRGDAIPSGPAIFTVTNGGEQVHNLYIEGNGLNVAAGDSIPKGASRDVSVTLKAGTYTLYCPVLDHRERGEQTTITIKP
ncbi:MAG: hypothetical protein QOH21_42 [Acidobacteriota bacterium]|jgi:hypothetical protein|nr:hypothetical protein [Acidobacteriota bacterium]